MGLFLFHQRNELPLPALGLLQLLRRSPDPRPDTGGLGQEVVDVPPPLLAGQRVHVIHIIRQGKGVSPPYAPLNHTGKHAGAPLLPAGAQIAHRVDEEQLIIGAVPGELPAAAVKGIHHHWGHGLPQAHVLGTDHQQPSPQVGGQLLYFYSGTLVLLCFDYFRRYIKFLFPVAVLVCYFRYDVPLLIYVEPLAFAVVLIGCAYYIKWFVFMRKFGNVAYGIYLFHFPVIQLSVWLGINEKSHILCFAFCVVGTLLLSVLSWLLLEKPILSNRIFSSK